MATAHAKLNPRSGGIRLSATRVPIKKDPGRSRGRGLFLSLRSGSYLNKPPLCFGDDVAITPAPIQKSASSDAYRHYLCPSWATY
jgi:hypothetical protein